MKKTRKIGKNEESEKKSKNDEKIKSHEIKKFFDYRKSITS